MGTQVVIPKNELTEFDLPRICVVTGATDDVEFHDVTFQYIPPAARAFAAFCGPIGYLVAMSLMRKTATGKLPFVASAHDQWKTMRVVLPLGLVGLIVAAVAAFAFGMSSAPSGSLVLIAVLLVVAIGGALGMAFWLKQIGPAVISIDDTHVTLELPSADAAAAFETRLHAAAVAKPDTDDDASDDDDEPAPPPRADGRDALDDELDAELKA